MNRFCATLVGLCVLPLCGLVSSGQPARTAATAPTVYLAGGMAPAKLVALTANVAASQADGIVLLDVPKSRPYLKAFLDECPHAVVHALGSFAGEPKALSPKLTKQGEAELWKRLFARADEAIVCAATPRPLLLQAACLAAAAKAPLFVLQGRPDDDMELRQMLTDLRTTSVVAVGDKAAEVCAKMSTVKTRSLATEHAVGEEHTRLLAQKGAIETLVLANPADTRDELPGTSCLAPWIASRRRGVLLLTNDKGDNASALITAALKDPRLSKVENLILVGDRKAIPMERRPNPLEGKDEFIELEPPGGDERTPFTLATGRLFHEELGIITLMLARQRLIDHAKGPRKALIVSNPGGGLPLLETISRHTGNELRNTGYTTTAMFRRESSGDAIRRLLPSQDVFLWEGHHSTLVSDYGVPYWQEPLRPSLVFLQSCLALAEPEAQPFLRRGAIAVVGSPSRTYSASGGAVTLAYFNALAYDRQTLGGALRQAKNFMLAYAQLKQQRLGDASKLGGANVRSAWAFTLWGDPTVKLPAPEAPKDALAAVRATVRDRRITLTIPEKPYDEVSTEQYVARQFPNGRLAGYLTKSASDDRKRLVPLLFAEVRLPGGGEKIPRLQSKMPQNNWIFTWDARRQSGYLLVLPRSKDRGEIHFDVE